MASIFGRAIIVTKTNKSGGGLAKGATCIVDAANDNAVTTTTTGSYTGVVGVVVEENGIANNASGRVQFGGHCGLITPNASVTRGHYALTHTVAGQCTDGGASRVVGAFGVFTTGGTTPEIDLFTQPDGSSATGNVATDAIWDAAGDLVQGTGANTAAKLTLGAAGTVVRSTGSTNAYAYPPGYEFDYVQITSPVTITATTEAAATTAITGSAVTYDGSTTVLIEFYTNYLNVLGTAGRFIVVVLYDGSGSIGQITQLVNNAAADIYTPAYAARRLTPSNASHTYSIRAYASGSGHAVLNAGAGGSGASMPAFIRITKI